MARAKRRRDGSAPRRPFWMSEQEVEAALTSLAFGVPAMGIAAAYGVTDHTLVNYLGLDRIAAKRAEMDGRLARSIYRKAMVEGDTTAQIYMTKARLGWRDGYGTRGLPGEDDGEKKVVVIRGGLPTERKPE
jgi:hypothetical protein